MNSIPGRKAPWDGHANNRMLAVDKTSNANLQHTADRLGCCVDQEKVCGSGIAHHPVGRTIPGAAHASIPFQDDRCRNAGAIDPVVEIEYSGRHFGLYRGTGRPDDYLEVSGTYGR